MLLRPRLSRQTRSVTHENDDSYLCVEICVCRSLVGSVGPDCDPHLGLPTGPEQQISASKVESVYMNIHACMIRDNAEYIIVHNTAQVIFET